jgi:hypothetical protein
MLELGARNAAKTQGPRLINRILLRGTTLGLAAAPFWSRIAGPLPACNLLRIDFRAPDTL